MLILPQPPAKYATLPLPNLIVLASVYALQYALPARFNKLKILLIIN